MLKRAGRAEDGAAALARHDDVSVSDLMAAAEEVGLDPGAVKRAAALDPLQHTDRSMSIWGAPLPRSLRATIDAPIPDLRHELTEAAERILGRRGEVVITQEGHFQWEESHGTGSTRLTLKEGSLTTSLEIETDRTGHYAVVLFGSFVAGLAALSAVGGLTALSGALGPLLGTVAVLAAYLIARPIWTRLERAPRPDSRISPWRRCALRRRPPPHHSPASTGRQRSREGERRQPTDPLAARSPQAAASPRDPRSGRSSRHRESCRIALWRSVPASPSPPVTSPPKHRASRSVGGDPRDRALPAGLRHELRGARTTSTRHRRPRSTRPREVGRAEPPS